jgi:hypothetical protein
MADTAAHLVDRVLPEVPVRQWVLSLPFALRYRLAFDAPLVREVLAVFVRCGREKVPGVSLFCQVVLASQQGHSGLSTWDRLSFHILYPEFAQVAEVVGTRVVETRDSLALASDWERRGALMAAVARNFSWTIGGFQVGTGTSLALSLAAGSYAIGLQHEDFLGRSYSYATTVRSLAPDAFARTISGPTALLAPEPDPLAGAALLALACRRGARKS